jgi:hypothetical protein
MGDSAQANTFFRFGSRFLKGEKQMVFKNKKFFLEADEALYMKLQALSGKSDFQQRDFQKVISHIANFVFTARKGKPI